MKKYDYYGVRHISRNLYGDDIVYRIGDTLPASYRWDDGESTGELLSGTSCIQIDGLDDVDGIRRAMDMQRMYMGIQSIIVAGDVAEYGEDRGELIIRDAVCVAII